VSQQNQKLQAEVGRLRQQVLQQNDAEQRLRQLTALENLPFAGNLQEVACQVIAYNTSDFAATVTIDKGRADGVTIGMPVVGSGGLVGMVVLASHHTATVRLVTDGQSVVGAAYGTAGTPAIVAGQGWGKPLSGQLVPADTRLPRGTLFSTSGLQGAAFPPGIPVARVIRASTGTVASQEIVTLAPVVDLAHLRYVAVLLWGPAS
jgi:rod shape-determining protein MreC